MSLTSPDFRPITNAICDEISKLHQGIDLLEKVHLEIGPYGSEQVSDELRYKINDYFGFDDSE